MPPNAKEETNVSETEWIEELEKLEKAGTIAPWKGHWREAKPGQAERLRAIYVPIPGSDVGSLAHVLSPSWTERDGEVWDAWNGIKRGDADLLIAARNALPRLLALARAAMNIENYLENAGSFDDNPLAESHIRTLVEQAKEEGGFSALGGAKP